MEISVGSIVIVTEERYRFCGLQGVVVEIKEDGDEDGPIGVRFPSRHKYKFLFDYPNKPDSIVQFKRNELRVDDFFIPLTVEEEVEGLFGDVWVVNTPKMPLISGDSECMHEGCKSKAYFRIFFNVWGCVETAYVCGEHASFHGKLVDHGTFSWKKKKKRIVAKRRRRKLLIGCG